MSLISGAKLDPKKYFKSGDPVVRGTAVDLKIGTIYDPDGNVVDGCYSLKPGEMVQVVSKEVFNLPEYVTGHVTYKTGLTRIGIWALTVGIVDSGWDGPIATTLLNFSKAEYPVKEGDTFLRVSLFEHEPVKPFHCKPLKDYMLDIKGSAKSTFPRGFLNTDDIVEKTRGKVMGQIRDQALAWIAGIAILFTIIQFSLDFVHQASERASNDEVHRMQSQIDGLKSQLSQAQSVQRQHVNPAATPQSGKP